MYVGSNCQAGNGSLAIAQVPELRPFQRGFHVIGDCSDYHPIEDSKRCREYSACRILIQGRDGVSDIAPLVLHHVLPN